MEEKDLLTKPLIYKRVSLDEDYYNYIYQLREVSHLQVWRELYFREITQGSLRASILCLLSVTLGSSFLSMPYLMKSSGVVLCLILFFFSAIFTHWTLKLMTKVAIKEGIYEYSDLIGKYYGSKMVQFTTGMCLVVNIGAVIAWNKFITDILSNLIDYMNFPILLNDAYYTKVILSMLIVLLIQVPVCSFNIFARFHVLSFLGALLILYIIFVSIFEFPYFFESNFSWDKVTLFKFDVNIIQTFCIFFFAFGNHSTIMNAISELDPNTEKRIKILVNYTSFSETFLYLVTMLVGYFSTYEQTDEIYINRPYQSVFMIFGKFFLIGINICNIGLYYYMIKPYFEYKDKEKEKEKLEGGMKSEYELRNLFTAVIVLEGLMLSTFLFEHITLLLSLLGATAQIYVIFVVPILLYINSFELTGFDKVVHYLILSFFCLIGIIYLFLFFSGSET